MTSKLFSASKIKKICKNIKLVITDVDGVLTDGRRYYSKDGEILKKLIGLKKRNLLIIHNFVNNDKIKTNLLQLLQYHLLSLLMNQTKTF